MSGLLDAADMATRLKAASPAQVMEWHRRYHWPHVKIGRQVRWTEEQADAIVRQHIVTSSGIARTDGRTARSASRRRAS